MNWNVITCSEYPPFSLTQVWIRVSHPRHSVAVTLSCVSGESGLWMKICLMLKLLSWIPPHITRYDRVYAPASTLYSQKMISLGSRLIACCKLAPTLARQMWPHNYVIDCNEYLFFTFSESINPWVYSLQFLCKSTNNSWRYERKCEWVLFFWTQCIQVPVLDRSR